VIWQQERVIVENQSLESGVREIQSQEVAEEGEEGDRICQLRH